MAVIEDEIDYHPLRATRRDACDCVIVLGRRKDTDDPVIDFQPCGTHVRVASLAQQMLVRSCMAPSDKLSVTTVAQACFDLSMFVWMTWAKDVETQDMLTEALGHSPDDLEWALVMAGSWWESGGWKLMQERLEKRSEDRTDDKS